VHRDFEITLYIYNMYVYGKLCLRNHKLLNTERIWVRGDAYTWFWWGNLRETGHLGDPGVDGRIILRCIFREWDVGAWTGVIWLRTGTGEGTAESGNGPSGSIKCGEFLD
jgi:hypothetical protein